MKFDRLERGDVQRVFGARGLEMAKAIEYELDERNSVTLGDPPLYLLSMTLTPEAGPFERMHEVGHWYHCKLWPTISNQAPLYRTEACAIVAELELMSYKSF